MAQTAGGITTDLAEISKISTEVDFEWDGKQVSFLKAPYSTNASGWGSLLIPITVIKNGRGPTMLLTAGNHGDEYEGQVALTKLARELQPRQVQGRVIILPALNYPAVVAGTRLSPLDGRNMNRVFPGDRNGTLTLMIAHYVWCSGVLITRAGRGQIRRGDTVMVMATDLSTDGR